MYPAASCGQGGAIIRVETATGSASAGSDGSGATVSLANNILAYDRDWQFPAITEQHAFRRIRDLNCVPDGITYIAYPWATLIDKLQKGTADAHTHLDRFRAFCRRVPPDTIKISVCQHIAAKEFRHLFNESGIAELFWSHAAWSDVAVGPGQGIWFHPFPLYPVQVGQADSGPSPITRPYLFSFIGAKAEDFYLTQARNWIFSQLRDHPRGLIHLRETWHYDRIVYTHQIFRRSADGVDPAALMDPAAAEEFRTALAESVFSLCPSGSGPNSIRLWESLGAGAIPVILSDSYAPPGDQDLWRQAAIFCKETPEAIAALPERLEQFAQDPDRIAAMRDAGRKLWKRYGPSGFVDDIRDRMRALAPPGPLPAAIAQGGESAVYSNRLMAWLADRRELSPQEARFVLRACSGALLLDRKSLPAMREGAEAQLIALSLDSLPADDPVVRHFRKVRAYLGRHGVTAGL